MIRRWDKYYTPEEKKFKPIELSIYDYLWEKNQSNLYKYAIQYYGHRFTYKNLFNEVDKITKSFLSLGIKDGDVVTLIMPNTPEVLIAFYALNKIGAIANMVHPLSGEEEIKHFINDTKSKVVMTIDMCCKLVENIVPDTDVYRVIICSASESMPFMIGLGYEILEGYKIDRPKSSSLYMSYSDFIRSGSNYNKPYNKKFNGDQIAVIMHSGGTTGIPKSIQLTNKNFTSLAIQIEYRFGEIDQKVLAILPVFHAFGLGVTIYGMMVLGNEVILIPRFNAKEFHKIMDKYRPTVISGVPTLFEALVKNKKMRSKFVSQLNFLVSGGDDISNDLLEKMDKFLKKHGSPARLDKGYGLTESSSAIIATLKCDMKTNNIGIPFVGNDVVFVKPDTVDEVADGEEGEICVSGPTIMVGYLNNEEENNKVFKKHKNGKIYLHTGDIGKVDDDGYIHYVSRLKRIIITSGFNVYPSQIEEILRQHPEVENCAVIGIPHPYKVEVAKAFIVLKDEKSKASKVRKELQILCKKNLSKYSLPTKYEFIKELPKTNIGKVDYKNLK